MDSILISQTGEYVPLFDITKSYPPSAQPDFLVNTIPLGAALADSLHHSGEVEEMPERSVVVMQNHGFTTWGTGIQQAVFRAVYTHVNAEVQMKSMALHAAMGDICDMRFLQGDEQLRAAGAMGVKTQERPWELWEREVEVNPLYRHEGHGLE